MSRRYLIKRLAGASVTLLGVAVLVFVVLRLIPGDAITASLGTEAGALSPGQRAALEDYYGIGDPPLQQFFSWLGNVVTGNLGVARQSGRSVSSLVADALPVTLELAVLSTILGTAVGMLLGVMSASRPGAARDVAGQGFSFFGLITPSFVVATAFVTIVATRFRYFPNAAAYAGLFESPGLNLQQMLFPTITLSLVISATVFRTTRSAYLEASDRDFVRFARSKGVPEGRIRWRHVLPNAAIPIVTITGIQFGYLLGGTVIIEQIFQLPGLGRLVLLGIEQREYAIVQSVVLLIAAGFVAINLLVDLLYARIDPRVTYA
ncbi:MAG: ABC transporter permease [Actinomycetota bacterium]